MKMKLFWIEIVVSFVFLTGFVMEEKLDKNVFYKVFILRGVI